MFKQTKIRRLVMSQKIKPLTNEEYSKLRINVYKPIK